MSRKEKKLLESAIKTPNSKSALKTTQPTKGKKKRRKKRKNGRDDQMLNSTGK